MRFHYSSSFNAGIKTLSFLLFVMLVNGTAMSHDIAGDLDKMDKKDIALLYLELGFKHILPLGVDHIYFILGLYLLNPRLKPVLLQATVFTIAHSLTLGLAMFKVIVISPAIIEPIIALSILFVAVENLFTREVKKSRLALVFLFGLVHGMGFAGVLGELGLPQTSYISSLVLFNIGVELGQAAVIIGAFLLFGKWTRDKPWYRKYVLTPLSLLIAITALYWTFERLI